MRKLPRDEALEPGRLENRSSQPLLSGSEPRPWATSQLAAMRPLAISTSWKRIALDRAEKSTIPSTLRWVILLRWVSRALSACGNNGGRTADLGAANARGVARQTVAATDAPKNWRLSMVTIKFPEY